MVREDTKMERGTFNIQWKPPMDDEPIESRMHFLLRICAAVLALDIIIFSVAAAICMVFKVGLTVYNLSTALFILGALVMSVSFWDGITRGLKGLGGLATQVEVRLPDKDRPSVFSNVSLAIAGIVAVIASVVIPLAR